MKKAVVFIFLIALTCVSFGQLPNYDLKRWGIAKQVLTALGKNFQDRHNLYPIPQGEIDKSGGSITQNPGY